MINQTNVLLTAVTGLTLALLLCILSATYLVTNQAEVPDGILAIGSACAGALSTMLITPRTDRRAADTKSTND